MQMEANVQAGRAPDVPDRHLRRPPEGGVQT
jgi:hypothetical protein